MNNKTCDISNNIRDLLKIMNQKPAGFAFITKNNQLIGLFTDGDIRRLLLENVEIDDPISSLDIKMCHFSYDTDDFEKTISQLNEKIRVLPIVNKNMNIINYVQHDKRSYMPIAQPNLAGNELKYVTDALLSTWISSTGRYIDRFETDFSKFIGK